ncbi:MAG: zinc dependent phospholipase C family protein [Ruminococcus sp.]|nr:zinc dependent phospholipase C family protein [Ruminococcus sp.]
MSNWITHTVIAEKLLENNARLDIKGFTAGNIAPDCNIENADWTAFTPSRETTHYMSGENKLTADYDRFYREQMEGKVFSSKEHYSFLAGYYSHLITDVEYQKFVRDGERLKRMFNRIRTNDEMNAAFYGQPNSYDAVKKVFGRKRVNADIVNIENRYINAHPRSLYNTVLRKITEFPDYLGFLPKGAVVRKIGIMAYEVPENTPEQALIFFTEDEYTEYISSTTETVYKCLKQKNII